MKSKTKMLTLGLGVLIVLAAVLASCGGGGYGGGGGMATSPGTFSLSSPADGAMSVGTTPALSWTAASGASDYRVQIDTAGTFSGTLVLNVTVGAATYGYTVPAAMLTTGTMYHWRVIAENIYGQVTAGPRTFTP